MTGLRLAALSLLAALGCADARPVEFAARDCPTWKQDIQPLYTARCASCHGEKSYLDVLPQTSQWVAAVQDARHAGLSDLAPTLAKWIGQCNVAYETSAVHAGDGLMNPADPDFHGKLAQSLGFDLNICAKCHGADFSGGAAGASCLICHKDGPTACTTCHGQPPATGAHLAHVNGEGLGRKLDCTECHVKPTVYTDAGHLEPPGGPVHFGALAGANAQFDGARCSGVYCHGSAQPTWTADATEAACGTCHGRPPANHRNDQCASCHPSIDGGKHVDGKVDLGDGSGSCTACHGQPPATGAHLAHTSGEHRLRGPLGCAECHVEPSAVDSPGHIDHPPPATLTFGALAGSGASFSEATQTCANYCHGSAQPAWSDPDAAYCGSCHGLPPQDSAHNASMRLTDCATCHPATVDALGAIKVANGTSTHINGVIDVQP